MLLSICIPYLNDGDEVKRMVQTIRMTSPSLEVEVIVVDDGSDVPLAITAGVDVHIRNVKRRGAGAARHQAAEEARGEIVMLTDSHMRFTPGWFEAVKERMAGRPNVAYCGACLGLDRDHMDVAKPNGVYTGARLMLHEDDQIFAGRWLVKTPQDDEEISCLMGACYFVPRELFLRVGGTRILRMWGTEEEYLSMKIWLAGAEIRYLPAARIGHIFRNATPYRTECWNLLFNKIVAIRECLNPLLAERLIGLFPQEAALRQAMSVADKTAIDRSYQQRSDLWYLEKFGIKIP